MTPEQAYQILNALHERQLAIPFTLLHLAGGVEMGAFVAQIAWLSANASDEDHWFYLAQEGESYGGDSESIYDDMGSWEAFLGISKKRQEALRAVMLERGWLCHLPSASGKKRGEVAQGNSETAFIFTQRRGTPPRLYYYIDPVRYLNFLAPPQMGRNGSFKGSQKTLLKGQKKISRKSQSLSHVYKRDVQQGKDSKDNHHQSLGDGSGGLAGQKFGNPDALDTHLAQMGVKLETKYLWAHMDTGTLCDVVDKALTMPDPQLSLDFLAEKYESPNPDYRPQDPMLLLCMRKIYFTRAKAWRKRKERAAEVGRQQAEQRKAEAAGAEKIAAEKAQVRKALATIVSTGPAQRRELVEYAAENSPHVAKKLRDKSDQFAETGDETVFEEVARPVLLWSVIPFLDHAEAARANGWPLITPSLPG